MSIVKLYDQYLKDIADAIRLKTGSSGTITPANMASYVPNSYMAGDEGKVVSNGALVAQTARVSEITQNGTYDTTLNNEVVVNVSGGGVITGSSAPDSSIGSDGDLYVRNIPLPNNVNFVEYLQSSGTQYIDTGIKATQNIDATIKCLYVAAASVFGARESAYDETNTLRGATTSSTQSILVKNGSTALDFRNFIQSNSSGSPVVMRTETLKRGSNCLAALSVNNNMLTRAFSSFSSTLNQILFGFNKQGTVSPEAARIYRITYFDQGSPIADYIPCLDVNNVPCMWDNISQEYVYNDGTGDFAYGNTATPDILDPIMYIKENGSWRVVS